MSPFRLASFSILCIALLVPTNSPAATAPDGTATRNGTDHGYVFAGPKVETRVMEFKRGQVLISYHQKGVMDRQVAGHLRTWDHSW